MAAKSLVDAPLVVACKLRITWVLDELVSADGGSDSAEAADDGWDATQRKGGGLLYAASHDKDAAKRAAAGRLQKAFMKGAGSGQTKMKYHQEVDFGRNQLVLAKEPQNAADIALLGMEAWLVEVEEATETLATATGYGEGTARRPYERKRAALSACSATFADVERQLAWVIRHGHETDHKRARALLESLHGLANRYPAPSHAKSAEPAQEG
ncbi:MAG: hypothetical protein IPM54_33780 [Polyangiaceae bacterium]|nr:hypothetical protein [Polyangiaceae bacterium]